MVVVVEPRHVRFLEFANVRRAMMLRDRPLLPPHCVLAVVATAASHMMPCSLRGRCNGPRGHYGVTKVMRI